MSSPPHFYPACASGDIPANGTRLVKLGSPAKAVLICRSGDDFFAIDPWCSHAAQELSCGTVRDGWISCPAHGARFDLETGEPLNPPATRPVRTFPLRVAGEMIEIAV